MIVTEIRAFPVSSTVVMRSTLFALANLGATLQTYNEDSGVIVATVSRWLGLQKQEVVARVRMILQKVEKDRVVAANHPEETRGGRCVARWNAALRKTDVAMVWIARGLAWSWVTSSTLVNGPGGSQPPDRYPV